VSDHIPGRDTGFSLGPPQHILPQGNLVSDHIPGRGGNMTPGILCNTGYSFDFYWPVILPFLPDVSRNQSARY
jgi:hypothetical protein